MKKETLHIRLKANLRKSLTNIKTWALLTMFILLGAVSPQSASAKILFFNSGGSSYWDQGGAWFSAWVWAGSGSGSWYKATKVTGNYYYIEVPDASTGIKWVRFSNGASSESWNSCSNTCNGYWNATGDLTIGSTNNLLTIKGWGTTLNTDYSWGTYKPTSTGKLTASSASVNTNTNVTLTPSLTSNTTYNEIKSTTYAISPSTGASINGNTFTATVAGTYTITATITYNPKGYSNLTSTVKPTTTITVNAATYTVKKSESGATTAGTVKLGDTTLTTTEASINSGRYELSITAPTGYKVSVVSVSGGSLTAGTTGSAEYTGTVNVSDNTIVTVTYAKLTYSISYNANNGSGAPTAQTKYYGEPLTLSSIKPTRTGYTFQNWNTASNGSGTAYASGASYTANAAATLYAQWKANTYTITYDANGGVNPPAAQTKIYGETLTLSSTKPTRTGYTFQNWNTKSDGTGTKYESGAQYTANAAATLYAQWEEICEQSATGGTGSFSNGTITLSATFNTCGYAYIGFQWKEEGNQWCYDNSNDCYVQLGENNKKNETVTTTITKDSGTSYVFRPYIVVGNDANNWLYGTEFTVGTCTLPIINSTDADFNKNNFADFAALYVTDCSGKEITGYQWYKDGDAYVSTCNYTTKDGSEVGDAGQTNNIRPNAAGDYTCKVTYDDGTNATSAPFTVTATSGTTYTDFNSPIPVIMVNTGSKNFPSCPVANETASKHADEMKKKLSVDVKILHNGSIVYDRKARMAYRGSSSLNFQKKSYAFCPGDANCGDDDKGPDYVQTAKLNMLGIGEATDKDWVLYAAAADPSMLRNRMVFDTYQAMTGNWGVHSHYVELIINGEYKGVYLMMDKVTQNKKRVNVKWEADGSSKGFIVKFDKTDIVDRSVDYPDGDEKTFLSKYSGKHNISTYDTTNDQAFEIEYPEKEDIQEDGGDWYDVIDYIKGMFNSFEEALAAGDYTTVQQYIDYESWADWFILNEFTKNVDAYRASCVFTYDGTKIKANPLWDQELSFNNQSVHANRDIGDGGNKGCENVNYLLIQDDGVYSDNFAAPFWFTGKYVSGRGTYNGAATTFAGALLNDPCFVQTVKNRWEIHKQGALSKASLEALITAYETELTSAVRDREANFWSSNSYSRNTLSCPWPGHTTGYYDDEDGYAGSKADITAWISDAAASGSTGRRAGLDAAIDDLEGTGLTISFEPMTVETTPWMPVTITVNNESGYQYTLTYTDGELDKQANVIIEKSGDTYKYHVPRPAAWNKGDEAVVDERTDIVYGLKATLQMGDDKVVCGSSNNGEAPSATATIILQDEPNENCPQ